MWTPPTYGPHCGNLSWGLQTPVIQPTSNMLSLDMLGTELRPTETLTTGKDHNSHVRWQSQCPGIIYPLSSILTTSSQPFSVGQPTSSLVRFSHFSIIVLSGKTCKTRGNVFIRFLKKQNITLFERWKCLRTPLINLEDVFLTGLCANRELGLELSNNKVW